MYCHDLKEAEHPDATVHCLMGLVMPTGNMGQSRLSERCEDQVSG